MRRILNPVARIAVACSVMGVGACATTTMRQISIDSTPPSANVEIRKEDGTLVEFGRTPMTADLEAGEEIDYYTVTITLAGYRAEVIPVDTVFVLRNLFCILLAVGIGDPDCNEIDPSFTMPNEYRFNRNTINVELKEVTTLDGRDTTIYAVLTIVGENGRRQQATVEMTPAAAAAVGKLKD